MKSWQRCAVLAILVIFLGAGSVSAQKLNNSFSLMGGYWKPSLEQANDALQLWEKELKDQDIRARGDDTFSGTFTAGAALLIGLNERTALRAEGFFWKKKVEQTAHEEQSGFGYSAMFDGEAGASVRIIPLLLSAQFYVGNLQSNTRPYLGGGLGLALTSVTVEASGRTQVTSDFGNYTESDDFQADDSGSSVILHFFGGVEIRSSEKIAFFVEGRYLSGNFNVQELRYDVDEDVSLAGFQLHGGVRLAFGN